MDVWATSRGGAEGAAPAAPSAARPRDCSCASRLKHPDQTSTAGRFFKACSLAPPSFSSNPPTHCDTACAAAPRPSSGSPRRCQYACHPPSCAPHPRLDCPLSPTSTFLRPLPSPPSSSSRNAKKRCRVFPRPGLPTDLRGAAGAIAWRLRCVLLQAPEEGGIFVRATQAAAEEATNARRRAEGGADGRAHCSPAAGVAQPAAAGCEGERQRGRPRRRRRRPRSGHDRVCDRRATRGEAL
eukprot:364835-Chlamydomonas_euryale.AAC.1